MTIESRTLIVIVAVLAFLAIIGGAVAGGIKLFARAIAYAEGFGVPNAIPTVRNNPGDLKLPRDGGAISTFPTVADGWDALYRQLQLIVSGRSSYYSIDMTIAAMGRVWTATEQQAWTSNVVSYLREHGVPSASSATTLAEILI
jgi:hypothetical protein